MEVVSHSILHLFVKKNEYKQSGLLNCAESSSCRIPDYSCERSDIEITYIKILILKCDAQTVCHFHVRGQITYTERDRPGVMQNPTSVYRWGDLQCRSKLMYRTLFSGIKTWADHGLTARRTRSTNKSASFHRAIRGGLI